MRRIIVDFSKKQFVSVCLLIISNFAVAQIVEAPQVSYVSFNPYNLNVTVAWYASPSANIDFVRVNYVYDQTSLIKGKKVRDILRNQNDSLIFDVFNSSDVDNVDIFPQEAKEMPLSFAVDAYASTGNNSTSLKEHHSTMFCKAWLTTCPLRINLEWTAYHGYSIQVDEYQIIEVDDLNVERVIETVGANVLQTEVLPNQNEERRFFVRAIFKDLQGNTQRSTTNMVLTNNNVFKYPAFISAHSISVTPENAIQMAFTADTNTDFSKYIVQTSINDSLHFETIDTVQFAKENISPLRLNLENEFSIETLKYYRVAALDNCNFPIVYSPAITPIRLQVKEQSDVEHLLQWSEPNLWSGGFQSFRVLRWRENAEEIATVFENNYVDNLSNNYHIGAKQCYYIETSQRVENENVTITSNVDCVTKNYRFLLPNAINPNSLIEENRTFQPKYAFVSGDYELQIFDRYGSCIFTSKDIHIGWDGSVKGKQMPAGMYQYKVSVKNSDGTNIERIGSFNLLYK